MGNTENQLFSKKSMILKQFIISIILYYFLFPLLVFGQNKDILVIESYHAEYHWDASYKQGLKETLGDKYNLVYFEMDTKRLPESEFAKRAQKAWDKYKKVRPILVVLGDDNALKYLGPKFINTDTPVVYLGINNNPENYGMDSHVNITGVLERPLLKPSITLIKDCLKIKKTLILFDAGTTAQAVKSETFYGEKSLSFNNIHMDMELIGNYEMWQKTVLNAKKQDYDVILIGLYHTIRDNMGKHMEANKVLEWTSEKSPIPLFAFWDFSVGAHKTIGGYVLFGKEQGRTAGKIALEILSGKNPGDIPPKTALKGRFLFSKSQLKAWGVTLPDDIAAKAEYTQ